MWCLAGRQRRRVLTWLPVTESSRTHHAGHGWGKWAALGQGSSESLESVETLWTPRARVLASLNDPMVVSVSGVRFGVCVCMGLRGSR